MFCYNIAKTVASYTVPLGGLDAIVFTGGIGEKSHIKRQRIAGEDLALQCHNLDFYLQFSEYLNPLGVKLDSGLNDLNGSSSLGKISSPESKISVFVIKTEEELIIAKQVLRLLR